MAFGGVAGQGAAAGIVNRGLAFSEFSRCIEAVDDAYMGGIVTVIKGLTYQATAVGGSSSVPQVEGNHFAVEEATCNGGVGIATDKANQATVVAFARKVAVDDDAGTAVGEGSVAVNAADDASGIEVGGNDGAINNEVLYVAPSTKRNGAMRPSVPTLVE